MKKTLFLLLIVALNLSAESKLDSYSKRFYQNLKQGNVSTVFKKSNNVFQDNEITYVKCLVKVDNEQIEKFIIDNNGKVIVKAGNIWSIQLPLDKIMNLLERTEVHKMSFPKVLSVHNKEAKIDTKVDLVHKGTSTPKLKGEEVLVGICDTGIDLDHPDFIADDTTRIEFIWDISNHSGVNKPNGYDMGREFNSDEIDAGTCSQTDLYGHGTHVTGTAAGNGNWNSDYTGMAPHSNILFVKTAYNEEASDFICDVDVLSIVQWVFEKADLLQKPVVINMSFGWTMGPHDGTSLLAEGLANLVGPGKIIVTSAGNSAVYNMHTGSDYKKDEYYETLLSSIGPSLCDIIPGLCPDDENYYATGLDMWYTPNTIDSIYITPWYFDENSNDFIKVDSLGYGFGEIVQNDTVFHNNKAIGFVSFDFDDPESENTLVMIHNNGDLNYEVYEYYWSVKFKTKDIGRIDSWGPPDYYGFDYNISDKNTTQLFPDEFMCISYPASSKKVISVGSYITLNEYTDDEGNHEKDYWKTIGEISNFSSRGPFRDGRMGPLVAAPGDKVISARSNDDDPPYSQAGIIDSYYIPYSGTSMSSPVVTGIVALMLEVKPNLTYEEISDIIVQTSREDKYTDDLPNIYYGYGKIDALAAIKSIIESNVKSVNDIEDKITIYPTVVQDQLFLDNIKPNLMLKVFDINGNLLLSPKATNSIDVSSLAQGIYYLNVRDGMQSYAIKFIVEK